MLVGVAAVALCVVGIVLIVKDHKRLTPMNIVVFTLLVVLVPVIGPLIYLLVRKSNPHIFA